MNGYDLDPTFLKKLFGLGGKVSDNAFEKVGEFLEIRIAKRKATIRHAGTVETESRFLVEGMIGMYYMGKLSRLYFPGDVFMDFESYQTQMPSKYRFRSLGESFYISLSYPNETLLLKEIPEFTDFSKSQIAKVRHSDVEWHAFTQMNYRDKLKVIEEKFPKFTYDLTNNEKASLLGVSYATAARIKKESTGKKPADKSGKLGKLLHYPFPAYVHTDAAEIEEQTVSWAFYFHSILRNNDEITYYKEQKFSYLSSCLYPEIDIEKGVWISKLYLWLFYLDDLTDDLHFGQKAGFWDYLLTGVDNIMGGKPLGFNPDRITVFLNAFSDLATEFDALVSGHKELKGLIFSEVLNYMQKNKIEAEFKDKKTLPSWEEYQVIRPAFSGGNLALALCAFESSENFSSDSFDWKETSDLRVQAAKLIYLTNDLISYQKETDRGDFMNAVALLMQHKGMSFKEAQQEILNLHAETLEEFMVLERRWREEYKPENSGILKYLKQIKYKIAGSVHWSLSISPRYRKS
ncbi:terpene synthase family protein [uncultured Algoriphagus sp.]|uniref:terpene synthase family protein n=1 Tax=uncultured Algoriphagus sp. TaxID=417365 RepID=UPI0030EE6D6F